LAAHRFDPVLMIRMLIVGYVFAIRCDSSGGAAMVTIKKAPGRAQFEISIDGKPNSYRDRKDIAIAAAEHLKRKFPYSEVVVKHLPSREVTVAAYKPHDDTH
jgi:hypothetical protein